MRKLLFSVALSLVVALSANSQALLNSLTGGVGYEKTWEIAMEYPLFFFGTDIVTWIGEFRGEYDCNGDDCWDWQPDFEGQESWILGGATEASELGTITFGAVGDNLYVKANKVMEGVNEEGTFVLNETSKYLRINSTTMPRDTARIEIITEWDNLAIFNLQDSILQVGVMRDNDPDDGDCWLVYNFIPTGDPVAVATSALATTSSQALTLYPNPVESILYIASESQIARLEVFGIDGRMVKRFDRVNESVDLSDLRTGTYIIKATNIDNSIAIGRVVKR